MLADEDLAELGLDVIRADRALLGGEEVVPGLVERRLPAVDEQRARRHRRRVELACRLDARPDRVHVRARLQPLVPEHRLARVRRRDDDVGAAHRLLDAVGAPRRRSRRPAPRAFSRVRLAIRMRSHGRTARIASMCERRLDAGADDRQLARVVAGEQPRRDGRDGRGADRRDRRRVHQRPHLPGLAGEQRHRALVRVEPARRVVREDGRPSSASTAAEPPERWAGIRPMPLVLARAGTRSAAAAGRARRARAPSRMPVHRRRCSPPCRAAARPRPRSRTRIAIR